jgi:hypothetical protein
MRRLWPRALVSFGLCAILIILKQLCHGLNSLWSPDNSVGMELFLNLCWLLLLVPAHLLWRQRRASPDSYSFASRPFVSACALGCALVLLFPVISATDDLHTMRPEMEESERALRNSHHCPGTLHAHALTHFFSAALFSSVSSTPAFERIGTVLTFIPQTIGTSCAPALASRAPPSDRRTSL